MRLVKAELLKVLTTSFWWIFGLIALALWALTTLINAAYANSELTYPDPERTREQIEIAQATNLFTSGQFVGVLIVMMIGAIVVTNEFFHQTATTTFLTTPRRERVLYAKVATAVIFGLGLWLVTTVPNLVATPLIMTAYDAASHLGEPEVWQAIGLDALAFALWAVFGVGAGVLIRSQIAATVTLSTVYVVGYFGAAILFSALTPQIGDWFGKLQVLVPPLASQLMVAGTELPGEPARWVGAVVLIGYAVLMGTVGTLIMKRRDVS